MGPPFFGSIVLGEMTDESDVDLLVEFAGRESPMDLSGLTNRGLSGGDRAGGGRPHLNHPDRKKHRLPAASGK